MSALLITVVTVTSFALALAASRFTLLLLFRAMWSRSQ